ncbi:MAG: polyketide synthase, partial [Okeania sp. SIO2F4]|uniref:type I polyketide synthase n=1 Tax=Okeania sp. SIO2F4 TaxID=2607790 RepID=UPI00142C6E11
MNQSKASQGIDYKALMGNALLKIETLESQLKTFENKKKEPIAIIGMSCRFPGEANSPEAFWEVLSQGVDTITQIPQSRWNVNDYYDPDPDVLAKVITQNGGFVSQVDGFDAQFFGISPREAQSLDPQQRMLLEVSWEAIERANIHPDNLLDSQTGVFIGVCANDYLFHLGRLERLSAYWGTGNALSACAGRLSYLLGLIGPSLTVDTACSSSLVSVHLACQSIRDGECDMALAGGINLLLSPQNSIVFSKAKMLSPDGRCKTFDVTANGYVRGEGCGIIVLKRLSEAVANKDNILGVIRGSAINQDGASGGLTVPNGPSQQKVIRQALANGGVKPGSVSYIEAHGTGTSLGDPIEVGALGVVFGKSHSKEQPLIIGTAKTNIGHLEGGAGIAGLMKVVLQMQNQQIAQSLHFNQP